jgi:hypothetical protein
MVFYGVLYLIFGLINNMIVAAAVVVVVLFLLACDVWEGGPRLVEAAPPKTPPEHLVDAYTMHSTVPLQYFYVDDTMDGQVCVECKLVSFVSDLHVIGCFLQPTHFTYYEKSMENFIKGANTTMAKIEYMINHPEIRGTLSDMSRRLTKTQWLYLSMFLPVNSSLTNPALVPKPGELSSHEYRYMDQIRDTASRVLVVGSMEPWVEALFIHLGASEVVTLEYNQLTYQHPRAKTVWAPEFDAFFDCSGEQIQSFDFIVTMSSLDHDGLGRYGDPLNPNGDLESMIKLRSLLKADGKMILTVPIGPDVVVFNLHRRYGRIRLPALLRGWKIVDRIGWREENLDKEANWRQTYEPILLLSKDDSGVADEFGPIERCAHEASSTEQEL